MIVPVRCFSCGKAIGGVYEEYLKKVRDGKAPEEALNELKVERYCCRRAIFSHVDLLKEIMKYPI
jgi:DNA-directed RNA polymerase subunit N (RpoN/RPB10)